MDPMVLIGKLFLTNVVIFLIFLVLTTLILLVLAHNKVKRGSMVWVFLVMMFIFLILEFVISRYPQSFVDILNNIGVLS